MLIFSDGLIIEDDSLIEIKCPYSAKDYGSCIAAVKDKKVPYLQKKKKKKYTIIICY